MALEEKRRVRQVTSELVDREHRCDTAGAQYRSIYDQVLTHGMTQPVLPFTSLDHQE